MVGRWGAGLLLGLLLTTTVLSEPLRLVTGDGYAPFTGRNLPGDGMLTRVVQAVLAERGMTSTLDWQPWNRGYLKTVRGDYDATFPYVPSPEREVDFLYSEPLLILNRHIFSRAGDALELADLSAQRQWRLCIPLGWQPPPAISDLLEREQLQLHSPHGLAECVRLLSLGRDDLFVTDLQLGESAILATGASPDAFHRSRQLSSSTLHLIVPRSNPHAAELIEQFNLGLAALRASGEYQRLIKADLH